MGSLPTRSGGVETMRPLKVVTSGAQAAPVEALLPGYTGSVELSFGSSLGAAHDSIPTRIAEGQRFDLYLLAEAGHARLAEDGLLSGPFVPLVESRIGAAVAEGAPCPDISTGEALRLALLRAGSVAHAASASGIYLSTVVFTDLGIAEDMKGKARTIYSERVGRVVSRGDAELGFQQMSELIPIPGITIVGSLRRSSTGPSSSAHRSGVIPRCGPRPRTSLRSCAQTKPRRSSRVGGLNRSDMAVRVEREA